MGRPGLALGTAGKIRLHATPTVYRAVAWYRDYDGRCRQVERSAQTKAAAAAALRLALRDRARFDSGGDLTPDTRVSVLAEAWFAALKTLSPTTMQVYRHRLDQQILPGLGNLRVRELSVGTIERHLRLVADKHGPAVAKMAKSVLSGVCGLAARHDALDRNPVRDTGSIESPARKAPRALTADETRTLLTRLGADEQAGRNDVPDLVAFMLATGCRIGEATAVTWDVLDLDAGTIEVRAAAVRVRGHGLLVKSTKTDAGRRTLLPRWCTAMLRGRADRHDAAGDERDRRPVFPAPEGRDRRRSGLPTEGALIDRAAHEACVARRRVTPRHPDTVDRDIGWSSGLELGAPRVDPQRPPRALGRRKRTAGLAGASLLVSPSTTRGAARGHRPTASRGAAENLQTNAAGPPRFGELHPRSSTRIQNEHEPQRTTPHEEQWWSKWW